VAIDETSARPVDRDVVTLSRDERGRPALLRAGAPRPAPLGATAEEAARAHLDALAPLWVERRRAAAELTLDAARALRGGPTVVSFRQHVAGIEVWQGRVSVLLDGSRSLLGVSGVRRGAATALPRSAFVLDAADAAAAAITD